MTKAEWNAALSARHGAARQRCFEAATVAVCGLGGLGSHIAVCLARAGIGRLILIDFDRVELTNLHRQQYAISQIGLPKIRALAENLRAINPFIELISYETRLTEQNAVALLSAADVVCEAFDDAEAKAMLTEVVLTRLSGVYLVAASGMAGFGSPNDIQTKQISKHFYVCGDGVSEVTAADGLAASRVMLCAAHQAHTVLRILEKKEG